MNDIIKYDYEIIDDRYYEDGEPTFYILRKIYIFGLYFAGQLYGVNGDSNIPFPNITSARRYLKTITPPKPRGRKKRR